jgi:hypothetical protein
VGALERRKECIVENRSRANLPLAGLAALGPEPPGVLDAHRIDVEADDAFGARVERSQRVQPAAGADVEECAAT